MPAGYRPQKELGNWNGPEPDAESTGPAFSDMLKPTNFDVGNVRIWELKDKPGTLVRENMVAEGQTLEDLEQSIEDGEALFAEMRDKYGIHVVSMHSMREKNPEGKKAIFTIVDKIDGLNLSKMENLPTESKSELEALYLSLGRHYEDAWKQKTKFWSDCRSDQFVYGNKKDEQEKHFFVVDVDPKFNKEGDNEFDTIEAALGSLCHDLLENEQKFTPKVRFEKARGELLKIIEKMLEERPGQQLIIEARAWLTQNADE